MRRAARAAHETGSFPASAPPHLPLHLPLLLCTCLCSAHLQARDEIVVHRDGLLRAPLPAGIGRCEYVDEIDDGEIDAAFARLTAFTTEHADTVWDISKSFAAE